MSASVVQARYEELEQIAARFAAAAEDQQALQERVNRQVEVLRSGGWQGKGVAAFLREMDGEVRPAEERLISALQSADQTATAISTTLRDAEADAASLFQNGLGDEYQSEQVEIPRQPPEYPIHDFVTLDPSKHIFTDSYLRRLKGSHFSGEDTPQLNRAMEQLLTDQNMSEQERNRLLDRIADMRGRSRSEFRAEYQRFLVIQGKAAHPSEIKPINEVFHGDHLGSTNSLRFGKIVGDTFGIDPVFGSMLNPTGGMPGSNNLAYNAGPDDPVGQHSAAHDAGGFLRYQYGLGPGYDYLGLEKHRDPNDPLTGQRTGMKYWLMEQDGLGSTYLSLPTPVASMAYPGVDGFWNTYELLEGSAKTIFGAADILYGLHSLEPSTVMKGGDEIRQGVQRIGYGAWESLRSLFPM